MEEKFLKTRAERQEARQITRSADSSGTAWDRLHFEDQSKELERNVTQRIHDSDVANAQENLNLLKAVVGDATSSHILTAHDMAKANANLSRLQGLIDTLRGDNGTTKRFAFSSKPRKGATAAVPSDAAAPPSAAVPSDENRQNANVYGHASNTSIFIGSSKAVFLRQCENCDVFILPAAGSVFISDCSHCRVYVACHQLRLKNCNKVSVYVWCASRPIIECCTEMRFGPYSCWTGLLHSTVDGQSFDTHEMWVERVGDVHNLEHAKSSFTTVDDFQWLKKTVSPHWTALPPEMWEINETLFLRKSLPRCVSQ